MQKHVTDPDITRLITMFLRAGVVEEGRLRTATTGTPQGGVISPLLANLVLDATDKYVKSHGNEAMVRYADDFVIFAKTQRRAKHVMAEVITQLQKLGLKVNEEKSSLVHSSETFVFLGYVFGGGKYYDGDGGKKVSDIWKKPSPKAINAFKDKIRILTRRQQPKNQTMLAKNINPVIRGWANYFNEGYCKTLFTELDQWYRMRIRSFIHKKKSYLDNYQNPNAQLRESGFIFLADFMIPAPPVRQKQGRLALRV
jgi:group II intron reverse transcriptase/maturase